MAKFKVLIRLLHNGDFYNEGAEIELTPEEAAPLLAINVVEEIAVKKPAKSS